MNNFNIKNNKGFVLLFTTILSSIVLAISIGVASIALKEINFSTSTKDTNEAFFASDTGVECALYNDKSTNSVFQEDGPGMIECLGESIPLSGDFPVWSFVISGLGGDEDGCAKVVVDKSALPTVKVTSKGYNVGDTACESSNPYRVERELEVTFNEVEEEVEEKILVGGHFDFYDSILAGRIARINLDGSLDISFNTGTGFNSYIYSLSAQSDGKILAGGYFTGYNSTIVNRIARLNTDGSLDTSFNIGTGFESTVIPITIQNDGKILVGGGFTNYNGTSVNRIARLNPDGSLDTSFNTGTGFNSTVFSISIQNDGKILVGGQFTSYYDGTPVNRIARLNPDGSLDTSFNTGTGFNAYPRSIVVQNDGKILVGGQFTSYNGTSAGYIARLNTDGSLDTSFNTGTGFDTHVFSLTIQNDSKILAGGNFSNFNSIPTGYIARLNTDGSFDATFNSGTGFNYVVYSLIIP